MMSPPELDTSFGQALRRSLFALHVFARAMLVMSRVLPDVPDWIWKPLSKLFPQIAALEDTLLNAGGDNEFLPSLARQRADWEELMREQRGAESETAPKDWTGLLIGATIPDFLDDHSIDFSVAEFVAQAETPEFATQSPIPDFRPDHADVNRYPDLSQRAEVSSSEPHAATVSNPGNSGFRRAPHRTESYEIHSSTHPYTDHTTTTRKPIPRARPPPSNPKAKNTRRPSPRWCGRPCSRLPAPRRAITVSPQLAHRAPAQ